jgi:hypothetical protein
MLVMAIGMAGSLILITTAIASNNRNRLDTTSTLLSQMVLERITAKAANIPGIITLSDCAGTVQNINTAAGAAPVGNGALMTATGDIDWTVLQAAVPAGYGMTYVACGAQGTRTSYDIRWNVLRITAFTNLVTVSARKSGTNAALSQIRIYAPPVTLRTIGGI